ncbi:MAG: hypothetical protein LBD29_01395, partial [Treponema sp.]|nr:hypothetical protein [Treponema sp.]
MKENVLKMREKFLLFVEFSMKTVFFLGFALLCLGSLQAQQAEALDDVIAEKPGLYADSAYQGPMNLSDGLDWIALNAQNNRVYTIVLESDQAASINSLDYSNKRVTVRLKASGGKCTVRADTNTLFETASFVVYPGVTFMLEAGVSLIGLSRSRLPLVVVQGGTFIMNGGTISGNAAVDGGGVSVKSGGT